MKYWGKDYNEKEIVAMIDRLNNDKASLQKENLDLRVKVEELQQQCEVI